MALADVVDVELPTLVVVSRLADVVAAVCPSCDLVSRRDAVVVVRVGRRTVRGCRRCRYDGSHDVAVAAISDTSVAEVS